jgi:acetyl esterase/lipase
MPPSGVNEVAFMSGELKLRAWVAYPRGSSLHEKVPAVVYFHGGFAFGPGDFEDAKPFLDAGYALMCPMLRGENGNPGNFELFMGEVDDAKAAVEWLARQDRIDASRIFTFGHSAGGAISALLSLHDVPIRHGGSSGGLYGESFFHRVPYMPFDANDWVEIQMRILVGNTKWMRNTHYAFVGEADASQAVAEATTESVDQQLLTVITIEGDHHSSLAPSIQTYLEAIKDATN